MIAGIVISLLAVAIGVAQVRRTGDPAVRPTLTATPSLRTPTPTPVETDPAEMPTGEPNATASPSLGDEPREPTDADAATFASSYTPPGADSVDFVAVDLTGDERKEIVFASLTGQRSRVDIAVWDGRAYRIAFTGEGGAADQLDRFFVRDFTGDGFREVVTVQSVGAQGQSLAIWGYDGSRFRPMLAQGGCWDGSHVYGIVGAEISEGTIEASCDGSPLPTAAWPTDIYVWRDGAWTYESTRVSGSR